MSAGTPSGPAESATVFIVDDDDAVRRAFGRLVRGAGYSVEAFGSAEEFLACPRVAGCGCIVLDLKMPGRSGIDLQAELRRRGDDRPIVFVTGHGDVPSSVQAMKLGACDFLTKPVSGPVLLDAIAQALGRHRAARAAAEAVLRHRALLETLTPREREVLDLVVAGLPNKQIGSQLGISEATVKVHRGRVMQKLGARSLPELVRLVAATAPSAPPPASSPR